MGALCCRALESQELSIPSDSRPGLPPEPQIQPLSNVRVLDLTHVFAGPFCTYQLAVLGATVIKIEAPDLPDMMRIEGVLPEQNRNNYGTAFQAQNANKQSLALDLQQTQGRQILHQLLGEADVLVHNYAGKTPEKLGFDYDTVHLLKPDLVYCSISGFGKTGHKADHPAYDTVIQAFSGLMAANGFPASGPVRVGPPMVDYGTGAQAALAIVAALLQRSITGSGQKIDVSMSDAALMLMSSHVTDTLATGASPQPCGNSHPHYAGYATYTTKDNELLMIGAWTSKQISRLFEVLDEPVRAVEILKTERESLHQLCTDDTQCIASHIRQQTAAIWEDQLNEAHIPAARVRSLAESLTHEQISDRQVLQASHIPDAEGPAKLPVAAFQYQHGSPSITSAPPRLGQHSRDILVSLGYQSEDIATLLTDGVIAS